MKSNLRLFAALMMVVLSARASEPSSKPVPSSKAETPKSSWDFTPDPKLPNVLIIGDSISIGYTLDVRGLLAGKANVFRPVSANGKNAENCNGTTKGVKSVDRWLGNRKWAVIHFNFGLHDLKHVSHAGEDAATSKADDPRQASVEVYRQNLEAIVQKLQATGAQLIFATTTPVAPGTDKPLREPETPPRYNAAAEEIMKKHGIRINDLFAFCAPQLKSLQLPNNVHFTKTGSQALAGQVAKAIEQALGAEK